MLLAAIQWERIALKWRGLAEQRRDHHLRALQERALEALLHRGGIPGRDAQGGRHGRALGRDRAVARGARAGRPNAAGRAGEAALTSVSAPCAAVCGAPASYCRPDVCCSLVGTRPDGMDGHGRERTAANRRSSTGSAASATPCWRCCETLVNTDSGSYDKPGVDAVGGHIRDFLGEHGIASEVTPGREVRRRHLPRPSARTRRRSATGRSC